MSYVFDTSALIGAWVRTYPPDLFPRVWHEMDSLASTSCLIMPEEVLEEIGKQDDELLAWMKARAEATVMPTTRAMMLEARAVLADHPHLTKTGTGRGKADPFVIALASLRHLPVITQERAVQPQSRGSRTSVVRGESPV